MGAATQAKTMRRRLPSGVMFINLPEVLDEREFFERKRMDRQLVELAILLYNFGLTSQTVALSRLDLRRAVGRGGLEVRPEAGQRLREVAVRRSTAD